MTNITIQPQLSRNDVVSGVSLVYKGTGKKKLIPVRLSGSIEDRISNRAFYTPGSSIILVKHGDKICNTLDLSVPLTMEKSFNREVQEVEIVAHISHWESSIHIVVWAENCSDSHDTSKISSIQDLKLF